jgi:iron complex outermembrane recepter protein
LQRPQLFAEPSLLYQSQTKMIFMQKIITLCICLFSLKAMAQQTKTDTSFNKTQKLTDVVVKSKKPFIEQQIDKTVINVQADMSAVGSSAFDMLQKAPGINITSEDVINMSGKAGVNVMIDGRPTQMGSKELAAFLRSMPASTIDKIELITNPSAKFDAQGNAGIINIRLKKNKIKGTNGNISLGYTQQQHYRSNGSASINHRSGKINAFANVSIDNNLQHTTGFINRNVTVGSVVKNFNNTTVDIDRNVNANIRTGVDVYLNKKSTFGVLFNTNANRNPFNTPGVTNISSNGVIDSSLITTNDNLYKNKRYNSNLNYKYEDTLGNELNIDADYTSFKNTNLTNLTTNYLDKLNSKYNASANDLDVATTINIYAIKADYTKQLKKQQAKIETGVKLSSVTTSNNLMATSLVGAGMMADTGRSNMFTYKENVYAAYANFSQRIKKFEYQIGLRVENSVVKGNSVDLRNATIKNPDTNYVNLFPSAFVSYKINEKNMFAVSYSKRINRPDYQAMNPFETIYDIYTSEKGNPYLKPQFTNNFELKYTYRYALNIAVGYNHTTDYSQTITTQIGEKTIGTQDNIGSLDNAYLNISAPMPITKWWEGYANITGFYNQYKGKLPSGILNEKTFGLNYYIQQNFNLGKGWSSQLSSWFNAGTKQAIFKTAAFGSVDFGVKKKIMKDKASIRLNVNDIFNTQRYRQTVNFGNMDFTYERKWESRGVRLQFAWSFGKSKYQARDRETNQDGNRIKVKN